jgi:hypothetical protein
VLSAPGFSRPCSALFQQNHVIFERLASGSFFGCRFSIGLRNSSDKSLRLALTVGYRVLI